jgi:RND family efflux transporter MFP subunit
LHAEIASTITLLAAVAAISGCGSQPTDVGQKPPPPAKVENASPESALATVTLSPEAEARLGIQTVPVEYRKVGRTRTYGGEVVVPPGRAITVSAPVAGRLVAPADGTTPVAGTQVKKGRPVFRLLPLLPAERDLRVEAEKEVASSEARLEAARARVKRAKQLLHDEAGSVRAVEQAQEELALAEAALKAGRARLERLDENPLEAEVILEIESPRDALIQRLHAGIGQTVAAATPLFEIAGLDPVWIRVPVYVGEMSTINRQRGARVHGLSDPPGSAARLAKPVSAPPSADPDAATADLFFELPNAGGTLRPGEKVGVTLTLRGQEESLVVPWSAILHDIHGGTWVYENSARQVFVRRRVEVRRVAGDLAVISRGPTPGTKVVTTGAAELFGTEFGIGK